MSTQLIIAELLATRLCHDLTGPIGAVNNGVEFLSESGADMSEQALELIVSSAQEASSRLQFFRVAYGRVNTEAEASLAEKKQTVVNFFSKSKIVVDWPDSHTDASGIALSNITARLLLNMVILVAGALIKGGTLSIRLDQPSPGATQLRVTGNGSVIKWEKDMQEALAGRTDTSSLSPKTVQAYFTHQQAEALRCTLSCNAGEDTLELVALLKA